MQGLKDWDSLDTLDGPINLKRACLLFVENFRIKKPSAKVKIKILINYSIVWFFFSNCRNFAKKRNRKIENEMVLEGFNC
jgi:hypothetical protein